MYKFFAVVLVIFGVIYFTDNAGTEDRSSSVITTSINTSSNTSSAVAVPQVQRTTASPPASSSSTFAEYGQADSGKQIQGTGTVIRLLSDDNDGSRHQRFIIRLATGQTLLVAHNIDLAPRINSIAVDDSVEFDGEYEWNSQGGVVHWTHHDPNGRHRDGFLWHKGRIYQ